MRGGMKGTRRTCLSYWILVVSVAALLAVSYSTYMQWNPYQAV